MASGVEWSVESRVVGRQPTVEVWTHSETVKDEMWTVPEGGAEDDKQSRTFTGHCLNRVMT